MALPALHPVVNFLTGFDSFRSNSRLGRDLNGLSRFFSLKASREVLYKRHQIGTLLAGECIPLGHVRSDQASSDGIKEIFVGGQGPGRGGAALKHTQCEITRLGIEPREVLSITVSQFAMTTDAVSAVVGLGGGGVTGEFADVALYSHPLLFLVSSVLRPGNIGQRQDCSCGRPQRPFG